MKTFVAILSALAVASALDVDWKQLRPRSIDPKISITGGDEAAPGAHPYQVGLFLKKGEKITFCGGSLISEDWVLTAAQCVDGVEKANVVLGGHRIRDKWEAGRVEFTVSKENLFKHEEYNPSLHWHDIGLIRIPTVKLTDKIQTIQLPSKSDADIFEVLRFIEVKVMMTTDDNIYIDGAKGQSTCKGDSGGPMATDDSTEPRTVIGATSFGLPLGCEEGFPVAFTRVTSFLDWIACKTGIVLH